MSRCWGEVLPLLPTECKGFGISRPHSFCKTLLQWPSNKKYTTWANQKLLSIQELLSIWNGKFRSWPFYSWIISASQVTKYWEFCYSGLERQLFQYNTVIKSALISKTYLHCFSIPHQWTNSKWISGLQNFLSLLNERKLIHQKLLILSAGRVDTVFYIKTSMFDR